jgi:UDP-glucose:O-linked fucose beta-1,3-glucosyltransferase
LAIKIYNLKNNLWQSFADQEPEGLAHDPRFCIKYEDGCATWISDNNFIKLTKEIINLAERVLFVVKTCKIYHIERLPIIFQAWRKAALNVEYFSDVAVETYYTKVLPEVYRNTETGHCQKTEAILKYFNKHVVSKGWKCLIITDDDTILGVRKILELLHQFNEKESLIIGSDMGT